MVLLYRQQSDVEIVLDVIALVIFIVSMILTMLLKIHSM